MSLYELLDYDGLQERIGITPGESWHCGSNPAQNITFEEVGVTYDASTAYTGNNQQMAGGVCLSGDINVNGLLLNHRDANGTIWLCTGIEGWWTTPPSEIPDVPKPFWDGSLLTTGRYLSRTITISGVFIPPDPSLVWYNRNALIQVSSIVRGVGLLAMCGNETPSTIDPLTSHDPAFDPPKMAIIQSADVPLFDTTRSNGFTQFSLSFRCVNPTKISVYEKHETLPIEYTQGDKAVTRERKYKAFTTTTSRDDPTTSYVEVENTEDPVGKRPYSQVKMVNLDTLIKDEEWTDPDWPTLSEEEQDDYYTVTGDEQEATLYNAGNYFAFPIFVFDAMSGVSPTAPVIVRNVTTNEQMRIQKPVPTGSQLVVDTGMRKVGVVDTSDNVTTWKWDDRNYLTLTSAWISLAPGENTLVVSKEGDIEVPTNPLVYWRDTWIG